ncbi:MAG: tetratricopeptide repeat protein [Kofleriaceae bacterium]
MGELISLMTKLEARRGCLRAVSAAEHYERGLECEAREDSVGAIAAYRRALASRPQLADALNNLGRLLHDQDQLGEAEALYRRAIAAQADVALYWFNLGVICEDTGRTDEAITAYESALAIDGSLADAHFNLARQLEQLGRRGMDELVLRRAVRHLKRYRDLVRTA